MHAYFAGRRLCRHFKQFKMSASYMYVCVFIYIHIRNIYIYTYIHTYIHTCTLQSNICAHTPSMQRCRHGRVYHHICARAGQLRCFLDIVLRFTE